MPQDKLKSFINYSSQIRNNIKLNLSVNPIYAFSYPNPAPTETPSDAYFLLNGSIFVSIKNKKSKINLGITVYNLFNTVYSDHLSSLRDAGFYDMGRNIGLSLKIQNF
jgi:iron complex outermembrane receptor protein